VYVEVNIYIWRRCKCSNFYFIILSLIEMGTVFTVRDRCFIHCVRGHRLGFTSRVGRENCLVMLTSYLAKFLLRFHFYAHLAAEFCVARSTDFPWASKSLDLSRLLIYNCGRPWQSQSRCIANILMFGHLKCVSHHRVRLFAIINKLAILWVACIKGSI